MKLNWRIPISFYNIYFYLQLCVLCAWAVGVCTSVGALGGLRYLIPLGLDSQAAVIWVL